MIVGLLVNLCIKNHETLDTPDLRDFRAISGCSTRGVYEAGPENQCQWGEKLLRRPI